MGRGAEGGGWQDDGKISSYPRQNLQGTGVQTREPPSDRWAKKKGGDCTTPDVGKEECP